MADKIGSLPDTILCHIISFLQTKQLFFIQHNLQHPSIKFLVHREDVDEGSDQRTDKVTYSNMDNVETSATLHQKSGTGHFNFEETDPLKSGAMRSSLWELILFITTTVLLHHGLLCLLGLI